MSGDLHAAGVPESDHAAIQSWSKDISSRSTSHDAAAAMIKEFCDGYLTDLVRRKNENPGDDLLSRLIVEHMRPGTITPRKVVSLARLFLNAGHESTTGTLGLGLAALLYHPEELEKLRRDPSLIKSAIEEILRFTDVTHSGRLRVAKEDIEIGGVTIRAGDAIIMHQPTADRENLSISGSGPLRHHARPSSTSHSARAFTGASGSRWREWNCSSASGR